jgi:hypothetical protein
MRRFAVLTLAILLTVGYFPGPATAVDNQGPACADITNGSGTYQVRPGPGPSGDAAFHFEFTLADAPCAFVTYYLYVTDSSGGSRTATYPQTVGNDTLTPFGTGFSYDHSYGSTAASPPTTLFVTGETKIKSHSADTTPTTPPLDVVLCDTNSGDLTYPDCPSGGGDYFQ